MCIFICTKQRTTSLFLFVNKQLCYSRQNKIFSIGSFLFNSDKLCWKYFFFSFIMILIQEVAPKRYNLCSPAVNSCIVEIRRDLGIGSELKVFVNGCLERLKVICCWKDGRRRSVPVSRCHRDKRVGECVCSVSIQCKRVGVLSLRKSCISRKWSIWRHYWFYPVRTKAMVVSTYKKEKGRRQIYYGLGCRECQLMQGRLSVW